MNVYDMELDAQTRLEQARADANVRRLLRSARAGTEHPVALAALVPARP